MVKPTPRNKITIGADPEFLLVNKFRVIQTARDYKMFSSVSEKAEIGSDGARVPVEIRPHPSTLVDIESFCANISNIFRKISRFCNEHRMGLFAGATYKGKQPIGGHIHFGGEQFKEGGAAVQKLVHLLDVYFTPITNFFIHEENTWRRSCGSYGRAGQSRPQKWGLEYRTPYSFLISPFLTKAFYSLAALIAYNYKKLPMNRKAWNLVDDYYSRHQAKKSMLYKVYKKIKPKLLKVMSYSSPNPKTNSYILSLFNLIEQQKPCKTLNVMQNYNLEKEDFVTSKQFDITSTREEYVSFVADKLRNGWRTNGKSGQSNVLLMAYGIDERRRSEDSGDRVLYLSENMPEPKKKIFSSRVNVETRVDDKVSRWKYSIGLSRTLRAEMYFENHHIGDLIKYVNKIDIMDDEELV